MPMRHFIGASEVRAHSDALELGLDLWAGPAGEEPDEERAARLDAGRDLLREDPELFDEVVRTVLATWTPATRTPADANVLPFPGAWHHDLDAEVAA